MKQAKNDFDYVLKVLDSCKTEEHLITVNNMFNNFKIKWEKKLYDLDMITFLYTFDFQYKNKKNKI